MVLRGRILEELLGDDAQHETKDRPAVSAITDGKNCVVEVRAASELRDAVTPSVLIANEAGGRAKAITKAPTLNPVTLL